MLRRHVSGVLRLVDVVEFYTINNDFYTIFILMLHCIIYVFQSFFKTN